MEQQETTTQKKIPSSENQNEEVKPVNDKSPTTPSNWWGGWISQAKEKVSSKWIKNPAHQQLNYFHFSSSQSASVLEAVKNDLNEITSAVADTFHVAPTDDDEQEEPSTSSDKPPQQNQQSSNTVNYMKQSLSTFFGSVTDALIPQLDDDDATEAVLITSDDTIVLSGFAKHLAELQNNDETYLEEPSKTAELAEKYRMWLEIVEQDQFTQQRVNKMLESSQILSDK